MRNAIASEQITFNYHKKLFFWNFIVRSSLVEFVDENIIRDGQWIGEKVPKMESREKIWNEDGMKMNEEEKEKELENLKEKKGKDQEE